MWFLVILFLIIFYVTVRLTCGINRSSACLVGKTAIVTGANSGLGYQTALNLASRGCKIIMADVADMDESQKNIIKYTGNTNILTKKLDLSSLQSVRNFASDILRSEERLDILINNAGIGCSKDTQTKDGLHPVMQINYFGHFLLTHLLIDLLKKSAPSRIVFTSSALAFFNNLSPSNLNYQRTTGSAIEKIRIYSNSKLAAIVASDIFAEKLHDSASGVTSNAVHPGYVSTPIYQEAYKNHSNVLLSWVNDILRVLLSKDCWQGSQTLVCVSVSKKLEKITGKYFSDCRPLFKPLKAYNKEWCKDIWEASETYVNLSPNEKL